MHRNLQRYIHYNSRWEAHVASQKLEAKQVADIREKIAELEDNGTELKDYTWLSQVPAALQHVLFVLDHMYSTQWVVVCVLGALLSCALLTTAYCRHQLIHYSLIACDHLTTYYTC